MTSWDSPSRHRSLALVQYVNHALPKLLDRIRAAAGPIFDRSSVRELYRHVATQPTEESLPLRRGKRDGDGVLDEAQRHLARLGRAAHEGRRIWALGIGIDLDADDFCSRNVDARETDAPPEGESTKESQDKAQPNEKASPDVHLSGQECKRYGAGETCEMSSSSAEATTPST